jgi:hypothetical protein
LNGGGLRIGLSALKTFQKEAQACNGYKIFALEGSLYGPDSTAKKYYASALHDNTVVTVNYNKQTSEISFTINGNDCGVAFTNVTGDLYPAVNTSSVPAGVTLM